MRATKLENIEMPAKIINYTYRLVVVANPFLITHRW